MRKIRICAHISLDGVIEPAQGTEEFRNGSWSTPYRSPAGAAKLAEMQGTGYDLLLGRRTYDQWAGFWPNMKDGPFAKDINGATKYVATHRPEGLTWGPVESLGADAVEGIRALKAKDGPNLVVWGSTTLTAVLFDHKLVDELLLLVYPVMIGNGKRPFSDKLGPHEFSLVDSHATPTGILVNWYRRADSPRS